MAVAVVVAAAVVVVLWDLVVCLLEECQNLNQLEKEAGLEQEVNKFEIKTALFQFLCTLIP